jgi:hypothetical protein
MFCEGNAKCPHEYACAVLPTVGPLSRQRITNPLLLADGKILVSKAFSLSLLSMREERIIVAFF